MNQVKHVTLRCIYKGRHYFGHKAYEYGKTYVVTPTESQRLLAKQGMNGAPMFTTVVERVPKKEVEKHIREQQAKREAKNDAEAKEIVRKRKEKLKAEIKEKNNKHQSKVEEEEKKKKKDDFGPLKGTKEWDELSRGEKAALTRKRNEEKKEGTLTSKLKK